MADMVLTSDGKIFHCKVTDFTMNQCMDYDYGFDGLQIYTPSEITVEVNGVLKETIIGDYNMLGTSTIEDSLAKKLNKMKLSDNEKVLLDKGVVDETGLLTRSGIEVVMNHLFTEKVKNEIVAKIEKLDK